jgi:hypothetical protein
MRGRAAIFLLVGAALLAVPGFGCRDGAGGDRPEPDKLELTVDGKELSISGRKLSLPAQRPVLVELLGEPSRVLKKACVLLVWDDLGVFAYEESHGGAIVQLSVAVGDMKKEFDFWPKKVFTGKLLLDGAPVTADTTIAAINRAKKGAPLKRDFLPFASRIDYGDVAFVITQAKGGEFDANGSIAEFFVEAKRR